jgi:hypothetical protein
MKEKMVFMEKNCYSAKGKCFHETRFIIQQKEDVIHEK